MKKLILAAAGLLLSSCNREQANLKKDPTPVHAAAVEMYTPKTGERYSASILPYRQINAGFRVGGFVESIHQVRGADGRTRNADPGDLIPQGTILASVRAKDYEFQVAQAEGQLGQARENAQAAKSQLVQVEAAASKAALDFQRANTLYADKALTKPELDAARAQYDATRAQVEAVRFQAQAGAAAAKMAEAALGTAGLSRQDTAIAAPFTGVVVQRSIEVGSLVQPGANAFVLADVSSVKASLGVPDRVVVGMRTGGRLSILAEALPDREFHGVVTSIAAVADSATRLFQVELTLPNPQNLLRPGMIATLTLGGAAKAAPVAVAPLTAVVRGKEGANGFAVMVIEGKQARLRLVSLGATYGDRIAVGGIKAGEQVISAGATLVADGETVEVIR